MFKPRTKEDFDKWYNSSNGDPWGYKNRYTRNRLSKSLLFINKFVDASFKGNIIELGAFNGDFSLLLCGLYKNAEIYVNDISEVAINQAKERTKDFSNVKFLLNDLLSVNRSTFSKPDESIILLLECLYYLDDNEYQTAINNIKQNFPNSKVFISVPIKGGKYFTEESLFSLFNKAGYVYKAHQVFNLRKLWMLKYFIIPLLNKNKLLRNKLANQVIYYFEPKGV